MKLRASRIERMLAKVEATLAPPPREWLQVIIDNGDKLQQASGVDFRLHDLRRTARTLMSRVGVAEDIAELAIGHVRADLIAATTRTRLGPAAAMPSSACPPTSRQRSAARRSSASRVMINLRIQHARRGQGRGWKQGRETRVLPPSP